MLLVTDNNAQQFEHALQELEDALQLRYGNRPHAQLRLIYSADACMFTLQYEVEVLDPHTKRIRSHHEPLVLVNPCTVTEGYVVQCPINDEHEVRICDTLGAVLECIDDVVNAWHTTQHALTRKSVMS